MASTKVQRIMTQPMNLIFRFLQSKARIQIWLFEQRDLKIEGRIIGFDEYMNLDLDDAGEFSILPHQEKDQKAIRGQHYSDDGRGKMMIKSASVFTDIIMPFFNFFILVLTWRSMLPDSITIFLFNLDIACDDRRR
ncbi:hypothetical protein L1049_022917 [Liquidambar formosana]|uniref:Small nuclear ribonucleoprotein E n=1 Tax=Liquidambar formosana TaxID=63359 RepID=A0AAP0WSF0_LIQFO